MVNEIDFKLPASGDMGQIILVFDASKILIMSMMKRVERDGIEKTAREFSDIALKSSA